MNDPAAAAAFLAVERVLGGSRTLSDPTDGAVERFVVLPATGVPRLLLPLPMPAMKAALSGFVGQRRWTSLLPPLIRTAVRVGGHVPVLGRTLSFRSGSGTPSPLRTMLGSLLGRDDYHLAMRLSFGRPNAKTVVAAISDDGEMLCFAKIGAEAMTNDLVAHEGRVLERFATLGPPLRMPRLLHAGDWLDGATLLVTEPLRLQPLARDARCAHRAADAFAAASHVSTAPLKDSAFWHRLTESIESGVGRSAHHRGLMESAARIRAAWGERTFDFGGCHGDWSRANVGLVDGRVAAIDWERCSEVAPRGIDTAHFALLEASGRSRRLRGRAPLDIEQIADRTGHYLVSAGRSADDARPLVLLDCLQMAARFLTAERAGLHAVDSTFEPALKTGLLRWCA